jgi:hypothetical protein
MHAEKILHKWNPYNKNFYFFVFVFVFFVFVFFGLRLDTWLGGTVVARCSVSCAERVRARRECSTIHEYHLSEELDLLLQCLNATIMCPLAWCMCPLARSLGSLTRGLRCLAWGISGTRGAALSDLPTPLLLLVIDNLQLLTILQILTDVLIACLEVNEHLLEEILTGVLGANGDHINRINLTPSSLL